MTDDNNITNKKKMIVDAINCNNAHVLHKGKNGHSKNTEEELDIEHPKPDLKTKIKDELKKHEKEQLILLKEYKQNLINFLLQNNKSIRVEDLKIYEPVYTNAIVKRGIVRFVIHYPILFAKIVVVIITNKCGYVQVIGKNIQ